MTQTIKKCNEVRVGRTYPVGHLRTAESIEQLCEYVDAGHPIADKSGGQAIIFIKVAEDYYQSLCYHTEYPLTPWLNYFVDGDTLLEVIKLAPLAYRNGRPLHVGDEVIIRHPKSNLTWARVGATLSFLEYFQEKEWKFADEVPAWWRAYMMNV
jgi:hypothetical protein